MGEMQFTTEKDNTLMGTYVKKLNDVIGEGHADGLTLAAAMNCMAHVMGIIMAKAYKDDEKREVAPQNTFKAAWQYTEKWKQRLAEEKRCEH